MDFCEIEYRELKREWNMTHVQSHDYYEIYCLLEGERHVFLEDKIFTLQANSFIVIPPFRMHKTEGGPYKRINVYISPNLLDADEKAILEHSADLVAFQLTKNHDLALSLLTAFSVNAKKRTKNKQELHVVKALLGLFEISGCQSLPQVLTHAKIKKEDALVSEVAEYINNHYSEKLTLQAIATQFYISKNSLCRKFFAVMKISVMEYCNSVRFSAAKNMLLTTKKSVTEIADLCGFSSANYFSLIFKRHMGISPLNYRKKR